MKIAATVESFALRSAVHNSPTARWEFTSFTHPRTAGAALVLAAFASFVAEAQDPHAGLPQTPPSLAAPTEAAPLTPAPAVASVDDVVVAAPPVLLAQNTSKHEAGSTAPSPVQQAVHERKLSEAERIAGLTRSIEADKKSLNEISADLDNPESEYRKAEAEFNQLDGDIKAAEKRHEQLVEERKADEAAEAKQELEKLQGQWKLAKERFQLAIDERKAVKQKVVTLQQKLKHDEEVLAKMTGTSSGAGSQDAGDGNGSPAPAAATPVPAPSASESAASAESAASPSSTPPPVLNIPSSALSLQASESKPAPAAPEAASAAQNVKPPSKELAKAAEVAEQKEAAALVAEQEAKSVGERLELLRTAIETERELLDIAQKKADVAEQMEASLSGDYRTKLREGAASDVLLELHGKETEARMRSGRAQSEARQRAVNLDELHSRYSSLQSDQIVAMNQAERMRREAESARSKYEQMTNPYTLQNILQWLIYYGPRILAILLVMAAGLWFSRMAERRIMLAIIRRGGITKRAERENRARTLVGVVQNATKVAILGSGILMILDTVGLPIAALMGGAAVFGLAIAFGAQSLIKDYFYGFMILLEQQYTVNDIIKIGDVAGQVERISLRMTVLRDLEGRVHFVPHGTISSATNMTHGWSRAVIDLGIAYKEDVDRVIALIHELAAEMREDETFGPLILEDLTMLGVDAFTDSAVMLKFYFKTRTLKQWDVKREMLRRIKRRFDDCGIEIPFPHRMVYHRYSEADAIVGPEHGFGDELPKRRSA